MTLHSKRYSRISPRGTRNVPEYGCAKTQSRKSGKMVATDA